MVQLIYHEALINELKKFLKNGVTNVHTSFARCVFHNSWIPKDDNNEWNGKNLKKFILASIFLASIQVVILCVVSF